LLALDAKTGKPLWEHALRPNNLTKVRAGLPVADGKVYCAEGGEEPSVTALDEKTGKPVWCVGLGKEHGNQINQPSVAGGIVFVATRGAPQRRGDSKAAGAVIALDAVNGKERWRRRAVRPSGRPLYTDGEVIACCFVDESRNYEFSLLNAQNGETLWTYPAKFSIYTPPAATIGKEVILIKPYGRSFYVADRRMGRQLARYKDTTNSGCGTTILAGGHAYVGTGVFADDIEAIQTFRFVDAPREFGRYGSLHAVDLKTGDSDWFCGTGNTVCGDPAISYGQLYFTSRDGRVYCFAPASADKTLKPDAVDETKVATDSDRVQTLAANKPKQPYAAGTAWPMCGGNPDRAGLPLPAMKLPLKPAWKVKLGGRIKCGAAIADGKIFIGSDAAKLVALKGDGGNKLWQFDASAAIRCSPAVADEYVYCGCDSGSYYALDRASGELKWQFQCGGPVQASPAIIGDVILFAASDHHVYALNRLTGEKLWAFRMRDFLVQAPPVVHGGQVFVGQWNDWVYALDLYTGEQQWRAFLPISIESPAYYRDKLCARLPNYLVEIDPRTGKRLRVAGVPYGYGGVAFLDGRVFLSGVHSQHGSPRRR
jgi:outer membrane protein assembly factor BamB